MAKTSYKVTISGGLHGGETFNSTTPFEIGDEFEIDGWLYRVDDKDHAAFVGMKPT